MGKLICAIYVLFPWCLFFQTIHLSAEIEKISLRWSVGLCTPGCAKLLQKEFERVPGVVEFSIDQPNAQAEIKWKNNVPFTFSAINVPSRLVGLSTREIRLKVNGTLSHDAQSVTLTSTGDNTRFELINPVVSDPSMQAPVNNLAARQLTPELRQKLIDAEQQKMIATIEGQLFMPGRSETLFLVVENLSLNPPSSTEAESKKYAETKQIGVRRLAAASPFVSLSTMGRFVDKSTKENAEAN